MKHLSFLWRSGVLAVTASSLVAPGRSQSTAIEGWGWVRVDSRWSEETFVGVESGPEQVFALRADGSMVGWGKNGQAECVIPELPFGVHYLAVAWAVPNFWGPSCLAGLRSDGKIEIWHKGVNSPAPPLPPGVTYVDVVGGTEHFLALRSDGQIAAWGQNGFGQCNVPPLPLGMVYVEIAAGGEHSVAVRSDRTVLAWGANNVGQCNVPTPPIGTWIVEVEANGQVSGYPPIAYGHTVARLSDGSLMSWGYTIGPPPPGQGFVQVRAGLNHDLARRADGTVVAWGDNYFGQCNVASLPPGAEYVDVAAGNEHSVALRSDGRVVHWGGSSWGQGNVPALPAGAEYVQVSASGVALARGSDGSIAAWGVGLTQANMLNVPALPSGVKCIDLAAGMYVALALGSDGEIRAWGDSGAGQLNVPPLPPGLAYERISAGLSHGVALRSDGMIVAWGNNYSGQCNVPALPPGLVYTEVQAGWGFNVARLSDGSVIAWGHNLVGACNVPSLPPGVTFQKLAVGMQHTIALLNDGSILAWGDNAQGQCNVPALPPGLTYLDVGAGAATSLATRSDGELVIWGHSTLTTAMIFSPPSLSAGAVRLQLASSGESGAVLLHEGPPLEVYCTSKPSSIPGCVPGLRSRGMPSASSSKGFLLTASPLPGQSLGLFLYTTGGAATAPIQNSYGFLCIEPLGIQRVASQGSAGTPGSCDGALELDFNTYFAQQTTNPGLLWGSSVDVQAWYRDPPNPGGANLTDAGHFVVYP
jgi:alpha-tubulin suppressor-like RCC1 family protein